MKHPVKYGEGPFDILTSMGTIEGILCVGSVHSSELSQRIYKSKTEVLSWDMVYVDCRLEAVALQAQGLSVGDRALVGKRRKTPLYLRDEYVAGYALDDKVGVVVLLLLAEMLRFSAPFHDLALAFTTGEEGGASGAAYVCGLLHPQDFIAIEVVPVAEEYPVVLDGRPVIVYRDGIFTYNIVLSRRLAAAGEACGVSCQPVVLCGFGSDASITVRAGLNAQAACLGVPTANTHGFEMASLEALENCLQLLLRYLVDECAGRS